MSASLELRSPFLDHHVIEFAASLPDSYKEQRGFRKRILCDTFGKYLVPGSERRKKRGFGVPLADWFRNEWKNLPGERLRRDFPKPGVCGGLFLFYGKSGRCAVRRSGRFQHFHPMPDGFDHGG